MKEKFHQKYFNYLAILAIVLIPSIYTTLFLGSMWDPYGQLEKLPVAVVNLDQPTTYQGHNLLVGKELTKNLQTNHSMDFQIVNETTAKEGLKVGNYYAVITIPKDFSANAATLMADKPKKMQLVYETNPGTNYIASKMSESAMEKVKSEITSSITQEYTQTLFDQIQEIGIGLASASKGSSRIKTGSNTLTDGTSKLSENLEKLSNSTVDFQEGTKQIYHGTQALVSHQETIEKGLGSLSQGTKQLKDGSGKLLWGLNTMSASLKKSLSPENQEQIAKLTLGLSSLQKGINSLDNTVEKTDTSELSTSLETSLTNIGTTTISGGEDLKALQTALQTFCQSETFRSLPKEEQQAIISSFQTPMAALSEDLKVIGEDTLSIKDSLEAASLDTTIGTLKTSIHTMATSSNILLPGATKIIKQQSNGLSNIQTALDKTSSPSKEIGLIQGMTQLNTGINTLYNGLQGKEGLTQGVKAYVQGVDAVNTGLSSLWINSVNLNIGTTKLVNGSKTLNNGVTTLSKGVSTLDGKLHKAAIEVNENEFTQNTLNMFSSPVEAKESFYSKVSNNGHAMAPYMMSVALWVGCLAFCIMFPPKERITPIQSPLRQYARNLPIPMAVAIIQALLMVFLLERINGFQPTSITKTIFIACLSSVSFMSMVYFMNAWLGKVGSFFLLIFMVLQLSGSAGTYPIQLTGGFFQQIHKFMPFTYTVGAFRSTIANNQSLATSTSVLVGILIIFSILTVVLFHKKTEAVS